MKQKEIWYANLNPAEGSEQSGVRPVVIISGNAMNDHLDICIVCPLTTKIKGYAGCIILSSDSVNNLNQDSEIITFQVRTVAKHRFLNKIGEITNQQLDLLKQGLMEILRY
ncbi:MAG: type II toxin-antitoxin system PemK/MazF family toxin [Saprospiraceae bacterium]|nr:MAG: type II toxin-antitoxin system PemK/MazF family toxin [Saprospiraceae bacterium]